MKDLLLIVDMQNVYQEGQPWGCRNTPKMINNIQRLLDSGKPRQVLFTRFDAPAHPQGTWAVYCKKYSEISNNSFLNEIIPELKHYTRQYPVYSKSTFSSYSIKEVQDAVQDAGRVLLTGVVAECCILATLTDLIDAGAKVLYMKDAIAGQTPEFERMIEKIAESFSTVHTEIITTESYLSGDTHHGIRRI